MPSSMIPKEIRAALVEALNGRGPYVFGRDYKADWHRIIQFKINRGREYGKTLRGDWFVMYEWRTGTEVQ